MTKKGDSPSWLKLNEGAIGPPIAHLAAGAGMLTSMAIVYYLQSFGHISRNWSVVLVLAGYCIPFAIAREVAARRRRFIRTTDHQLPDDER